MSPGRQKGVSIGNGKPGRDKAVWTSAILYDEAVETDFTPSLCCIGTLSGWSR